MLDFQASLLSLQYQVTEKAKMQRHMSIQELLRRFLLHSAILVGTSEL